MTSRSLRDNYGRLSRWAPSGSSALVVLYIVDSAAAVVQNVFLARFLLLDQYGQLAAFLSVGMFAFVFSDLGTGLSVCRLLASGPEEDWVARYQLLWTARILMSLVATTVFSSAAMFWFPQMAAVIVLLLLSEFFRSMAYFISAAARGTGKVLPVILSALCDRLGTLACSIIAVMMGWGLAGIAVAYLVARLLSFLVALCWVVSAKLPLGLVGVSRRFISTCLSLAPLGSQLIADKIVFYSMPLLISLLASSAAAGVFQASFKVALLPVTFCSALVGAYFPDFVKDASLARSPVSAVSVYCLVSFFGAPLVALFTVAPAALLTFLYGEPFRAGSECLRILGVFVVLNAAYQLSVHVLPAYKKETVLLRSSTLAALIGIVVAVLAIPALGPTGAAAAIALYSLIPLAPNYVALRGSLRLDPAQRRMLRDGWLSLAICLSITVLLAVMPLERSAFLVGWCILSGGTSLTFLARNRVIVRYLFLVPRRMPPSVEGQEIAV